MFVTGTHFHLGSGVQLAAQFLRWHMYYFWRTEEAGRPFFFSTEPAQSTQAIGTLLSQIPWLEFYVYYCCYELVFKTFPYTDHLKTYLSQLSAQYFQHSVHPNIDMRQNSSQQGSSDSLKIEADFDYYKVWGERKLHLCIIFLPLFDTVCEELDSLQITHKGWYFCFIQNCKKYMIREDAPMCQCLDWNGMNEFDLEVQKSKLSMWSVMVLVKNWLVF